MRSTPIAACTRRATTTTLLRCCWACAGVTTSRASACSARAPGRRAAAPEPGVALELVLPDRTRVALGGGVTIGRAAGTAVRLADPSVSRLHARIRESADGSATLEDAGSSYGTWLDDRRVTGPARLRSGARIRVGEQELTVLGDEDAGGTILVPAAAATATVVTGRPRLRSGYALKRLEAREGERRWVLKDLRSGRFVRLAEQDAELAESLDGTRTLAELAELAERRHGPDGPARLALLLAALGEGGWLAGDDAPAAPARRSLVHALRWSGAGDLFAWLYRHGGRRLLTRPALAGLAALALAGIVVFTGLVARRYGTPFVVAHKVGLGAVVFIAGRLAVAALHELAHGLVMASYGRRVREAGLELVLVLPYVYGATSDAWLEPRRRRIAVSAAGPVSDLCQGGLFALCCLLSAPGSVRDVFFQLAFGAYLGAFFNLNPSVERDGYQILADVLREPRLRERALEQLRRRLSGERDAFESPALFRYAVLVAAWSVIGAGLAILTTTRYEPVLARYLPTAVVWGGLAVLWVLLVIPAFALIALPLWRRR